MASPNARNAPSAPGAVFAVTTDRCPQVLCRLLGLIAQQDRLIERVDAIDTRRILKVTLFVSEIDAQRAAIIAEKMRQIVSVRTVKLREINRDRTSMADRIQADQ